MAPEAWSQALGLVLFVLLVLAIRAAHRMYVAAVGRRLQRTAAQPLPGRTRDLATARRAS